MPVLRDGVSRPAHQPFGALGAGDGERIGGGKVVLAIVVGPIRARAGAVCAAGVLVDLSDDFTTRIMPGTPGS